MLTGGFKIEEDYTPARLYELAKMDGEPVWCTDVNHWVLVAVDKEGAWKNVPFALWYDGATFTWNIENRGLSCYRNKVVN